MKDTTKRWTTVGWHNIFLEAPEDWAIGALSGDVSTGYLRLDDAEMPRVEIRWESSKSSEPIDRVVERYLHTLTKKRDKKAPPIKVRRNVDLVREEKQQESRVFEGFHWSVESADPIQAYGMLWRCGVCSRTVFIQILGRESASLLRTALRIIQTLEDHPENDRSVWSLYGMRFDVPASYTLTEHQLMTGRLMLRFRRDKEEMLLERLSLADMHLENRSFEKWLEQTTEGDVADRGVITEEESGHHAVFWVSGEAVDPATVHKYLRWLPWRRPCRRPFRRLGWHCPETNRLFTLSCFAPVSVSRSGRDVLESMVCH
jgi:hypothetical protein